MPKAKLPEVMPVRFREGTFDTIDAVAGENRRAAVIPEAVEAELKKREWAEPKQTDSPIVQTPTESLKEFFRRPSRAVSAPSPVGERFMENSTCRQRQ